MRVAMPYLTLCSVLCALCSMLCALCMCALSRSLSFNTPGYFACNFNHTTADDDYGMQAVLGGTIDASSLNSSAFEYPYRRGYQAVAIKGGSNNAIRGVRAAANNSDCQCIAP